MVGRFSATALAADRNGADFHVFDDNGVRANSSVIADFEGPQNLGAGANVDMVSDLRKPRITSSADGNLLKYKTIDANAGAGMNHDAIGVGNEQAAANVAVKRNIRTRYDTPKTMPNDEPFED
jgi:hypothetical protein